MAKSLTTATNTEKNKTNPTPINILEVQYGGTIGTKFYCDRDLSSPVTAEGRVLSWGNFSMEAIEESGTISDISIELVDTDLVLLGYTRSQDTQGLTVFLYQWFEGLSWPADRVTLLKGTTKTPRWSENPPKLTLEIENIQAGFEKTVGTEALKTIFPDIQKEDEGKILPLVYGRVERGKAVQVIDAKRTTLALPLNASASETIVTDSRDFPQGVANLHDLFIGQELVRGYFEGAKLKLTQRGKTITTGTTSGPQPNLMTFKANLTPNGPNWIGFNIRFKTGTGFIERQITNFSSPNTYGISSFAIIPPGTYFEIFGAEQNHDAGVNVKEKISEFKWIINDAPSASVEHIEILASVVIQGTATSNKAKNINTFVKLDHRYYTVNLNDSTWAGTLGHNVTSISMPFDPKDLPNTPYADGELLPTMTGINKSNPVDIIVDLAQKLNFTYPADFDTASETAVKTSTSWLNMGFVLTEKKRLQVLYDIAFQARISLNFEQGLLHFQYLENKTATSVLTITQSEREIDSLEITQQQSDDITNKVIARFRERGIEREIKSEDSVSIGKLGEKEKTINLWAHNNRAYAAAIATFWLRRWSPATEVAKFKTYLTSLEAERYDWVTLNLGSFYTSQPAQILGIEHIPGSTEEIDAIAITARVPKFPGCFSSCELYEETGCASACQQACQSTSETGCEYACETAAQDACSLTCVTTCELQCTTHFQMSGSCSSSEETTGSCGSSCTSGCQSAGCEASCVVACEGGGCQVACQVTSQVGCTDACQLGQQSQSCQTSCQGSCTSGCENTCQTGGCESSGCQLCCQSIIQNQCTSACEVGTCQSGCTSGIQQGGCFSSCTGSCEASCQASCEGNCQLCCQADGTETSYTCTTQCQTGCQQHCQTVVQEFTGPVVCQTACQCYCQTSSQTTPCTSSSEGPCFTACQNAGQTGCFTGCQTGCQGTCVLGCETGCEIYCQVGCQCDCQATCETHCTSGCEGSCTCGCQTSCEGLCMTNNEAGSCHAGCQLGQEFNPGCRTTCTVSCTTTCQEYCENACTTSGCQTACQAFCMTGGCETGCEIFCQVGCQCDCMATCQSNCTTGCQATCQCLCQTACQTAGQV